MTISDLSLKEVNLVINDAISIKLTKFKNYFFIEQMFNINDAHQKFKLIFYSNSEVGCEYICYSLNVIHLYEGEQNSNANVQTFSKTTETFVPP